MSKAAEDMEGMESAQLEEMGEEMMEEMMKKFEQMGEKVRDFARIIYRFFYTIVNMVCMILICSCRATSRTWWTA